MAAEPLKSSPMSVLAILIQSTGTTNGNKSHLNTFQAAISFGEWLFLRPFTLFCHLYFALSLFLGTFAPVI